MTRSRELRELGEAEQQRKKEAQAVANRSILKYLRKDRREMSTSNAELRKERDFKEALMRAGWPTLPPLPVQTCDAFHVGKPPLLPNRGFYIQNVRSMIGVLGIQTKDVNIVLRIPADDRGDGIRWTEVHQPEATKQPLEEYMTILITLDFRKYGRQIPSGISAIRHMFKGCSVTDSLLIEFIDVNCNWNRPPYTGITFRQKDVLQAWQSDVLYKTICAFTQRKRWTTLSCCNTFPDMKAQQEVYDDPWASANSKGQPTIVICARDADDSEWWSSILPAMRTWLKSDGFFEKYEVRFGVKLLIHRRGF